MASGFQAGSIIGSLVLDKKNWTQSVAGVKKDMKGMTGMSDKMAAGFKKAGMMMTIAGGAIVSVMGSMVKKASDSEETFAKFGTVFKSVIGDAETASHDLAKSYGLSTLASKDMLAATGDLLTGLGVNSDAALKLSLKTQQLAVDLASFTNFSGGAKGASEALTKAMLGERESIKSLGIVITEEMVKEKLLAEGKGKLTGLAYKQAAAEATLTIAMEQSKNAIGDYERTSGSFANQTRLLKAKLEDVAVTLGTQLLPIATKLVTKITEVVKKITIWTAAHPGLTNVLVKVTTGIGALMLVLGPLVMILPKLVASIGLLKGAFSALTSPMGLVAAGLALIAVKAVEAKKEFKLSMELYQKEMDLTGKKTSWFAKTWKSLSTVIEKNTTGIDVNKLALQGYNEEQRKARGVMSIVTGTSKALSGGVKFLGEKWQELADILPGAEEGTEGVNEKIIRTYELAETAAQNIGILTSSMGDFAFKAVSTQKVLENLKPAVTEVFAEAIPPAIDFGNIVDQGPIKLKDVERASEETGTVVKKTTTEAKSLWTEVSTLISDTARKWGTALVDTLGIAEAFTYQMKEFDNSYWTNAILNATEGYDKKKQFLEDSLADQEGYYASIIDNVNKDYEQKKKHIEATVTDEKEKIKMLEQLELQHQLDLEKYRTDQKAKEDTFRDDLVKLEEDYQGEIDQLKKDEAIAMEDHRKDELDKQKSVWNTLKTAFGTVLEDMATMFATYVAGMVAEWAMTGVKGLISGAKEAAGGIGTSLKGVGKAVGGIGKGIGSLITELAKGIAGAAKIIAKAAPQILIAAAVSLAIFAGFKAIGALFKGGGAGKDQMKLIADATIATRDMLRTDYKDEIHTTQNILRGVFDKVEAMCPKLDGVNKWLDEISNRLKDLSSVSAQSGLDMAITKPTMIMTHPGEHARITPAGHTSYGNVSLSFNIAAGDSRDMESWLRAKGARMFEDIMRQNLGGNAERIEADLARYRRY